MNRISAKRKNRGDLFIRVIGRNLSLVFHGSRFGVLHERATANTFDYVELHDVCQRVSAHREPNFEKLEIFKLTSQNTN